MLSSICAAENDVCLVPNSSLPLEHHLCSYPHLYISCKPVSKVLAGYYLLPRPATIISSNDSSQVNIKKKKSSPDRTSYGHWTVPSHSYDTVPGPGSGTGSGIGSGTGSGTGSGAGSGSVWGTSLSIPTSGSSGSSGIEIVKYFIVYVGKCHVQSAALLPVLC
jgi:hypothetical protein